MKKTTRRAIGIMLILLGLTIGVWGEMIQFPWSLIGPIGMVVALIGFLLLVRRARLQ